MNCRADVPARANMKLRQQTLAPIPDAPLTAPSHLTFAVLKTPQRLPPLASHSWPPKARRADHSRGGAKREPRVSVVDMSSRADVMDRTFKGKNSAFQAPVPRIPLARPASSAFPRSIRRVSNFLRRRPQPPSPRPRTPTEKPLEGFEDKDPWQSNRFLPRRQPPTLQRQRDQCRISVALRRELACHHTRSLQATPPRRQTWTPPSCPTLQVEGCCALRDSVSRPHSAKEKVSRSQGNLKRQSSSEFRADRATDRGANRTQNNRQQNLVPRMPSSRGVDHNDRHDLDPEMEVTSRVKASPVPQRPVSTTAVCSYPHRTLSPQVSRGRGPHSLPVQKLARVAQWLSSLPRGVGPGRGVSEKSQHPGRAARHAAAARGLTRSRKTHKRTSFSDVPAVNFHSPPQRFLRHSSDPAYVDPDSSSGALGRDGREPGGDSRCRKVVCRQRYLPQPLVSSVVNPGPSACLTWPSREAVPETHHRKMLDKNALAYRGSLECGEEADECLQPSVVHLSLTYATSGPPYRVSRARLHPRLAARGQCPGKGRDSPESPEFQGQKPLEGCLSVRKLPSASPSHKLQEESRKRQGSNVNPTETASAVTSSRLGNPQLRFCTWSSDEPSAPPPSPCVIVGSAGNTASTPDLGRGHLSMFASSRMISDLCDPLNEDASTHGATRSPPPPLPPLPLPEPPKGELGVANDPPEEGVPTEAWSVRVDGSCLSPVSFRGGAGSRASIRTTTATIPEDVESGDRHNDDDKRKGDGDAPEVPWYAVPPSPIPTPTLDSQAATEQGVDPQRAVPDPPGSTPQTYGPPTLDAGGGQSTEAGTTEEGGGDVTTGGLSFKANQGLHAVEDLSGGVARYPKGNQNVIDDLESPPGNRKVPKVKKVAIRFLQVEGDVQAKPRVTTVKTPRKNLAPRGGAGAGDRGSDGGGDRKQSVNVDGGKTSACPDDAALALQLVRRGSSGVDQGYPYANDMMNQPGEQNLLAIEDVPCNSDDFFFGFPGQPRFDVPDRGFIGMGFPLMYACNLPTIIEESESDLDSTTEEEEEEEKEEEVEEEMEEEETEEVMEEDRFEEINENASADSEVGWRNRWRKTRRQYFSEDFRAQTDSSDSSACFRSSSSSDDSCATEDSERESGLEADDTALPRRNALLENKTATPDLDSASSYDEVNSSFESDDEVDDSEREDSDDDDERDYTSNKHGARTKNKNNSRPSVTRRKTRTRKTSRVDMTYFSTLDDNAGSDVISRADGTITIEGGVTRTKFKAQPTSNRAPVDAKERKKKMVRPATNKSKSPTKPRSKAGLRRQESREPPVIGNVKSPRGKKSQNTGLEEEEDLSTDVPRSTESLKKATQSNRSSVQSLDTLSPKKESSPAVTSDKDTSRTVSVNIRQFSPKAKFLTRVAEAPSESRRNSAVTIESVVPELVTSFSPVPGENFRETHSDNKVSKVDKKAHKPKMATEPAESATKTKGKTHAGPKTKRVESASPVEFKRERVKLLSAAFKREKNSSHKLKRKESAGKTSPKPHGSTQEMPASDVSTPRKSPNTAVAAWVADGLLQKRIVKLTKKRKRNKSDAKLQSKSDSNQRTGEQAEQVEQVEQEQQQQHRKPVFQRRKKPLIAKTKRAKKAGSTTSPPASARSPSSSSSSSSSSSKRKPGKTSKTHTSSAHETTGSAQDKTSASQRHQRHLSMASVQNTDSDVDDGVLGLPDHLTVTDPPAPTVKKDVGVSTPRKREKVRGRMSGQIRVTGTAASLETQASGFTLPGATTSADIASVSTEVRVRPSDLSQDSGRGRTLPDREAWGSARARRLAKRYQDRRDSKINADPSGRTPNPSYPSLHVQDSSDQSGGVKVKVEVKEDSSHTSLGHPPVQAKTGSGGTGGGKHKDRKPKSSRLAVDNIQRVHSDNPALTRKRSSVSPRPSDVAAAGTDLPGHKRREMLAKSIERQIAIQGGPQAGGYDLEPTFKLTISSHKRTPSKQRKSLLKAKIEQRLLQRRQRDEDDTRVPSSIARTPSPPKPRGLAPPQSAMQKAHSEPKHVGGSPLKKPAGGAVSEETSRIKVRTAKAAPHPRSGKQSSRGAKDTHAGGGSASPGAKKAGVGAEWGGGPHRGKAAGKKGVEGTPQASAEPQGAPKTKAPCRHIIYQQHSGTGRKVPCIFCETDLQEQRKDRKYRGTPEHAAMLSEKAAGEKRWAGERQPTAANRQVKAVKSEERTADANINASVATSSLQPGAKQGPPPPRLGHRTVVVQGGSCAPAFTTPSSTVHKSRSKPGTGKIVFQNSTKGESKPERPPAVCSKPSLELPSSKASLELPSSKASLNLPATKHKASQELPASKPSLELPGTKHKPSLELAATKHKPSMELPASKPSLELPGTKHKPSLELPASKASLNLPATKQKASLNLPATKHKPSDNSNSSAAITEAFTPSTAQAQATPFSLGIVPRLELDDVGSLSDSQDDASSDSESSQSLTSSVSAIDVMTSPSPEVVTRERKPEAVDTSVRLRLTKAKSGARR